MYNKNVIHILAQYKSNSAIKIHHKESQPHFSVFCLIFEFPSSRRVRNKIYKMYCLYIIYFIFHSLWSFNDILGGF